MAERLWMAYCILAAGIFSKESLYSKAQPVPGCW